MSLTRVLAPNKIINGVDSWVSASSQLLVKLERRDYITQEQKSFENQIILDASLGDVTADFVLGDVIYYKNIDNGTPFSLQLKTNVITAISFSGGTTILTVDSVTTSTVGASYFNLLSGGRADYQVLFKTRLRTTGGPQLVQSYQTPNDGNLSVDMKNLINFPEEVNNYTFITYRYQEFYNGSAQGSEVQSSPAYTVKAKRQLGQLGGSNMWEYAPNEIANGTLGKTLTVFKEPILWVGYDRTISVLKDPRYTQRTGFSSIGFKYTPLNINKVASGAEIQGVLYSGTSRIWAEVIPPAALTDAYVRVEVTPGIGVVNTGLAESVDFRVQTPCRNPLYVEYLSRNAAYEQHMFEIAQEVVNDSELGDVFDIPITDDIGNTPKTIGRENITENQRLVVTAENLDVNTLRGLRDIKSSEEVFIYLNPTGSQKIAVRVVSQRQTQYSTGAYGKAYDLTIEFELPENYDYFDESEKTP